MSDISIFLSESQKTIIENEKRLGKDVNELLGYYKKAIYETENRIHAIYSKYADENGISVNQARKLIGGEEHTVFRKKIKDYLNDISAEGASSRTAQELNILSAKLRITREEELLANIYIEIGKMADKTDAELEGILKQVLKTNFGRNAFAIQKATGKFRVTQMIPERVVDNLVNRNWAKVTYSQSLWGHIDKLNSYVKEIITDGFIQGKSVKKMIRALRDKTDVCECAVERLIRTECKRAAMDGGLAGYKENEIKKYVFIGRKEHVSACRCGFYHNKVIDVDKAVTGVNYPPLHPNCECTARAYFENSIFDNSHVQHIATSVDFNTWKNEMLIKNEQDVVSALKDELKCDIVKVKRMRVSDPSLANKAAYALNAKGHYSLSLYDSNGRITKQFHFSDHGNKKNHPFGKRGEHVHDRDYEAYKRELKAYQASGQKGIKPTPLREGRQADAEELKIMEVMYDKTTRI